MPEGPEIRRAADRIEKVLIHFPIDEVYFAFQHLKKYETRLRHSKVERVETRGKAMIIRFSNELNIYSHNQLYGRWMISRRGHFPETGRQLRLALHCGEKSALLYSASDIEVLTSGEIEKHRFLSRLGPDILSSKPAEVLRQLNSTAHRRRRLNSLYLDQHFLAGVGNYLRSEILFEAKLNPRSRPEDCSDAQLKLLAEKSIRIPRRSYRHNGVTCRPDLAKKLKAEGHSRNQYRHWVFGREKQPCRCCGTEIIKEIAGRRYYYCPSCQRS